MFVLIVVVCGGVMCVMNDDFVCLYVLFFYWFYVDVDFARGVAVTFSREETRYVIKVFWLKLGDCLEVCDGWGMFGIVRLCVVDGVGVMVEVEEMVVDAFGSGTVWDVASAFGGLKGGWGDWLVEKCVEFGVCMFVLLLMMWLGVIGGGDRDGDKKWSGNRRASGGDDDGSTASGREGWWGCVVYVVSK